MMRFPETQFSGMKAIHVFVISWAFIFVLYLPAAQAGFVADFTGWLDNTLRYSFWDNINRKPYQGHSLYQFTQLVTWLFFQVAGINAWLWHLFFVSLHALNAVLLFAVCRDVFTQSDVRQPGWVAFAGTMLYNAHPALSEVIVWEPAYHYLQGFAFILGILRLVQLYLLRGNTLMLAGAGLLYFVSTFSLEICYLTPWLVLALIVFYQYAGQPSGRVWCAVHSGFVPMLAFFVLHIFIFRWVYGEWLAHIGTGPLSDPAVLNPSKPLKHLLNIALLARFWPQGIRLKAYELADTPTIATGFLLLCLTYIAVVLAKNRGQANGKVAGALMATWLLAFLLFLQPLWFQVILLVIFDRYVYFAAAVFFMWLALIILQVRWRVVAWVALALILLVNLRFSFMLSRYWMKSERIISHLLQSFPYDTRKTVLLLNLPQNFNGVPMIGAEPAGEFKLMHNRLLPGRKTTAVVRDVMAFNMEMPYDGGHVTVLNDSEVLVHVNQLSSWWWYYSLGGHAYETADYKVVMPEFGPTYKLVLRQPREQYLLLFYNRGGWRNIDWSAAKRHTDQY